MGDAYAMAFYGYKLDTKRPAWVHRFRDNADAIAWLHASVLDPRAPKKGKPRDYIDSEYESEIVDALGLLEEGSVFDDHLEPWHLRFAQVSGVALPAASKGAISKTARKAFLQQLTRALAAEPCELVRIRCGFERSEEDYVVAPKASAIGNRREHQVIELPELRVDPAWDAQLQAFAQKLGLPLPKRKGWLMASFAFR